MKAIEGEIVEKPKKLRPKDRIFVDEYVRNGGNATKAAMKVADVNTANSAAVSGHLLKKRNQDEIERRMEKYGLNEKLVMTKHKQLIESDNEGVAMKAVDTWYKVTKKENDSDNTINIHLNF